jgi:chromosome segregation ATPase
MQVTGLAATCQALAASVQTQEQLQQHQTTREAQHGEHVQRRAATGAAAVDAAAGALLAAQAALSSAQAQASSCRASLEVLQADRAREAHGAAGFADLLEPLKARRQGLVAQLEDRRASMERLQAHASQLQEALEQVRACVLAFVCGHAECFAA